MFESTPEDTGAVGRVPLSGDYFQVFVCRNSCSYMDTGSFGAVYVHMNAIQPFEWMAVPIRHIRRVLEDNKLDTEPKYSHRNTAKATESTATTTASK